MAAKQVAASGISGLRRWMHKTSGFCKYGLYHDDVLYEHPHVEKAITRLPQDIKDERNFRIMRALHLSMKKIYLPKEEWVTLEEDLEKGRYLQPYIEEVKKEMREKEEWNKQ